MRGAGDEGGVGRNIPIGRVGGSGLEWEIGRAGGGGGGDDDSLGDEEGCGDEGTGGGGGDGGGCGEYGPTCPLCMTAIGAGSGLLADTGGCGTSRGSGEAGGEPDTAIPPNTSSRCTISHLVNSFTAFACDATVAKSTLSMRGRMSAGPNA